ncbi:mitochondrial aldehyde dehydrogenase [Exophiala xenobiotica]|jgi:aldehyde dehydrogenase (NAD(P)+)|nr:mitochondrial aldehyde dehydrogenase [Exophiala xenobiotica]KAK5195282.1 mitochondrial aldehyde dehydrogenase [Exophiala xenobiotica]KAK5262431.1 mitochondrial aldehyde dehydrogenase [Exophiala xenobiotica]KAK5273085.1 mitochondrial aldehyde dehydrogenase [Exophiala xenobiotica]KAK5306787.1 mitochondrial aldehyde dehydrogenase [Exophiala xenobiotica]
MADLKVELTAPNGKKITLPTGLFIDNEFVKATSGQKLTSINPSDESEICSVEAASADDVDKAVKAARTAFNDPSWRDLPATDRGALMYKFADLIEANKETLATLETWDNGKPYSVALNEDLGEVIGTMRYYAGWADKIHGETIPTSPQKFAYTLKQPIGVCGQIIPWNYPLAMAAWKLGPALACGNTVVLKPAEQTPLSILYLATLIPEVFPKGVINIVNGFGREAGHALASHLDVDKIAFTGSTVTGKQIMKTASVNMKNITLETGGKSPLLVFDDADLDQASKWAHIGIMSNMGQICTATSRVLVQESVYDKFVELFKEVVKSTSKVGDPFADDTFQGPQVTKAQYERVLGYIEAGKSEGATLASGGVPHKNVGGGKGFFIEPTVFTNVKDDMKIYREEVFGPFVVIASFKTEEEALHMANDTTYGLGSAVFTKDIERAHRVAARIEAGMVWINSSNDSDFRVPFGGVKQSGIGRELGEAGLAAYSQTKAVHVNIGCKL